MGYQPLEIESLTLWWGLWRWDKIEVKIFNDRFARLSYEKRVVNGSGYYKDVKLGFFERRRGVTIQEKTKQELSKLVHELKRLNEVIMFRKQMEKEIKESVKDI